MEKSRDTITIAGKQQLTAPGLQKVYERRKPPAANLKLASHYRVVIANLLYPRPKGEEWDFMLIKKQSDLISGVRVDISEHFNRTGRLPRSCDGIFLERTRQIIRAIVKCGLKEATQQAIDGKIQ